MHLIVMLVAADTLLHCTLLSQPPKVLWKRDVQLGRQLEDAEKEQPRRSKEYIAALKARVESQDNWRAEGNARGGTAEANVARRRNILLSTEYDLHNLRGYNTV